MGVLQRFERRVSDLVEGAFAKAFKGDVHPVEIAAKLTREADDSKTVTLTRTLVPNEYTVALAPTDYARLAPYETPLSNELAAMVTEHAHAEKYTFVGPVTVRLEQDDELATGVFRVASVAVHDEAWAESAVPPPPPPVDRTMVAPIAELDQPAIPAAMALTKPAPTAHLLITLPGQRAVPRALPSGTVTLGRGTDVTIQLADLSVSRSHGEIRVAGGRHAYFDLASTNGTRCNGRPISESELSDGDILELGQVRVSYHLGDAPAPGGP